MNVEMKARQLFRMAVLAMLALVVMPQPVQAQKQKKFEEGIANGWMEGKGYGYEERVEGVSKRDRFKQKAREMGYEVHYFGISYVYFIRPEDRARLNAELQGIDYESEFTAVTGNYRKQFANVKGDDFKSVGTAYIYDAFDYHNWQTKEHWREFIKCTDVRWTGGLNNGLLEGEGCGFVRTKSHGRDADFVFTGTFHNGFMTKGTYLRHRTDVYHVEMEPFSEDVAWMKDDTGNQVGDRDGYKYSLIDAEGHILIPRRITAVKQNFKDGKSLVTQNGMDIVINKQGEMISLDENVATIKSGVFSENGQYKNQKSIVLPASTKIIAARAFRANSVVESIALPNGLTEIGDEAFSFCTNLKQIKIPSTVTKIGKQAFEGCDQLAVIVVPASVKTIGKEAFQLCENLSTASMPASLIDDIKGKQIFKGCNKLNSVSVVAANGRKAQDGKWYWKDAEDPEVVKARELARQKAAEEEAKRAANAIENSYDYPKPTEDAWFNPFETDHDLKFKFGVTAFSGYVRWDNPRLEVQIANMVDRYFFVNGKWRSPMYENYRECVAAAWFYFIHHKRRTRGLLEGQKW